MLRNTDASGVRRVTRRGVFTALTITGLCLGLVVPLTAAVTPASASSPAKPVWLCLPGQKHDPCTPPLSTDVASPTGQTLGINEIKPVKDPKIDCFYVYPTVSDQKTPLSNLDIQPEERSIALYQASYYSRYCRVFAPMYRQFTLSAISGVTTSTTSTTSTTQAGGTTVPPVNTKLGYDDVLGAWNTYLKDYNHGRGVVFIGHSQGSFVLEQLLSQQVDNNPAERRLLVSAIILGGNVLVKDGSGVGGTFAHIPACRSATQLGCVVAFSTYDQPAPPNSLFGRTTKAGEQVLCTNPAALTGGAAALDSVFPSVPFAPGTTIGAATGALGVTIPPALTEWVEFRDAYTGQCTDSGGAEVLEIHAQGGAPTITPVPDASWGLHLVDAQIALGNLVHMVGLEAAAYANRTGR
jgi:hypothetical protein